METSPVLFSVIICTYQRYDLLGTAIESVLAQNLDADSFDLWVMDNSPASAEKEKFAASFVNKAQVHYVPLDQQGLSNARNEGIQRSSGRYIVFMDDDAVAQPGWLAGYRDAFAQATQKVGAIGGKISPLYESAPPPWISPNLSLPFSLFDIYADVRELPDDVTPIGANLAFAREALTSCGGFPVALGRSGSEVGSLLSGEESALFDKMKANGWRLLFTPFAEVKHLVPNNRMTHAWLRRRLAWQGVTDQMKEPLSQDYVPILFSHLIKYLQSVPEEHQPFLGLFWDTQNPEIFNKQLSAHYDMLQLLLASGGYPEQIKFARKNPDTQADVN